MKSSSFVARVRELTTAQKNRLKLFAFGACLFCMVPLYLTAQLDAIVSYELLKTNESEYYLPSDEWLVPLSLGYREAAAGVIWVRLLVYFGEQHEFAGDFRHLEPYLVGITSLDPYFYRAYSWGSVAALYNGTVIHVEDVEMSIRMLERGLRVFPNDGDLHYYLGFQYYFELAPFVRGAEQERVRRIGIDETCTAALLGGGPPFLPLLCSSIAHRRGFDHIARERLLQALVEARDENTRTRIEERLESYMSPDAAFVIMQQIDSFRMRWRQEIPYVPVGLYLHIGPRPVVPSTDQVELPLPMDSIIQREEEELLYVTEEAADDSQSEEPSADSDELPPELRDSEADSSGEP